MIQATSKDTVLEVQNVWKIYCRNLKRAMWYGLKDLGREVLGRGRDRAGERLRPGEFYAVKDATFQVRKGECVALIGPNGAGKSTMLKMINGLIRPDAGRIAIRGNVGALIELGTGFNPILSGRENIYINAAVLGMSKREVDKIFDQIVDFAELGDVINDPVKTYSSGMRVRLGFSVAANLRPQLLIMDEVLAVGDVGFRMKCFKHLRTLVEQGVSIIVVTHAVAMLQRIATRAIVFGQGKIVFDGDMTTGSTVYEEMMNAKPAASERRDELQKSDRAWLGPICVTDDRGETTQEFQTGDTLRLEVEVEAAERIDGARLVVAIASPVHGNIAKISSVYQQFELNLTPGKRRVVLEFPEIPLLVGAYHFNVSLYGPESTDFFQRRTMQGPFRIVGPPVNADGKGINGMVRIDHRWVEQ